MANEQRLPSMSRFKSIDIDLKPTMSFAIRQQRAVDSIAAPNPKDVAPDSSEKTITCYIPKFSEGTVSCVKRFAANKCTMTTDPNLVVVPINAIIDSIEFFGVNNFATKDIFSIGLGQLNQGIAFPLIVDTAIDIANAKAGGFRQFNSCKEDGSSDRGIVVYPSCVNVTFSNPVTCGGLQISIKYHTKPV